MRDLISKVRLRKDQVADAVMLSRTYASAWHLAADELLRRWGSGVTSPQLTPWAEVTKVVDAHGSTLGFNVWLYWGEARSLGGASIKEEVE